MPVRGPFLLRPVRAIHHNPSKPLPSYKPMHPPTPRLPRQALFPVGRYQPLGIIFFLCPTTSQARTACASPVRPSNEPPPVLQLSKAGCGLPVQLRPSSEHPSLHTSSCIRIDEGARCGSRDRQTRTGSASIGRYTSRCDCVPEYLSGSSANWCRSSPPLTPERCRWPGKCRTCRP